MSAIWESANWTRQFGIRQTGNRQFGMLPTQQPSSDYLQVKLQNVYTGGRWSSCCQDAS
jgi:hypothetical protein